MQKMGTDIMHLPIIGRQMLLQKINNYRLKFRKLISCLNIPYFSSSKSNVTCCFCERTLWIKTSIWDLCQITNWKYYLIINKWKQMGSHLMVYWGMKFSNLLNDSASQNHNHISHIPISISAWGLSLCSVALTCKCWRRTLKYIMNASSPSFLFMTHISPLIQCYIQSKL